MVILLSKVVSGASASSLVQVPAVGSPSLWATEEQWKPLLRKTWAGAQKLAVTPVKGALGAAGMTAGVFLAKQVYTAYKDIETQRDLEEAITSLLRSQASAAAFWTLGTTIFLKTKLGEPVEEKSRKLSSSSGVPYNLLAQGNAMSECLQAFLRDKGKAKSLSLLTEKAGTRKYSDAFDDRRIPASIRLSYRAHFAFGYHCIAATLADKGLLPRKIHGLAVSAAEESIQSALRLGLGLPGVDPNDIAEKSGAHSLPEPMNLEEEERLWEDYLQRSFSD